MSTPYIISWLNRRYTGVQYDSREGDVTTLSIDVTEVIDYSAKEVYAYGKGTTKQARDEAGATDIAILKGKLILTIKSTLDKIFSLVRPSDTLILVVDGAYPMASIAHERSKRFISMASNVQMVKKQEAKNKISSKLFDTSSLTPGTPLMREIDLAIKSWIAKHRQNLPPRVLYYSHMVPGYAIDKIMDLIREEEIGEGYHVIYSKGEQVILSALVAPTTGIEVMRTYKIRGGTNLTKFVSIDKLIIGIHDLLGKRSTSIHDFVLMNALMGSKFLPKSPSMSIYVPRKGSIVKAVPGIENMIGVYTALNISLTNPRTGDIDWESFKLFLVELAEKEPEMLGDQLAESNLRVDSVISRSSVVETRINPYSRTIHNDVKATGKFNRKIFRDNWYSNAIGPKSNSKLTRTADTILAAYGKKKYGTDKVNIVNMCVDYLTGIAWLNNYYTMGSSGVNLDWYYKRHHAPMLVDISATLQKIGSISRHLPTETQKALNVIHVLMSVLPGPSSYQLPRSVSEIMTEDSSDIMYLYPKEFAIDYNNKSSGTALIPKPSYREISGALSLISLTQLERQLYNSANGYESKVEGYKKPVMSKEDGGARNTPLKKKATNSDRSTKGKSMKRPTVGRQTRKDFLRGAAGLTAEGGTRPINVGTIGECLSALPSRSRGKCININLEIGNVDATNLPPLD